MDDDTGTIGMVISVAIIILFGVFAWINSEE